jgi:hypothetical protein
MVRFFRYPCCLVLSPSPTCYDHGEKGTMIAKTSAQIRHHDLVYRRSNCYPADVISAVGVGVLSGLLRDTSTD